MTLVLVLLVLVVAAALGATGYMCEQHGFGAGVRHERQRAMAAAIEPARLKVLDAPPPPRQRPYDWATEPDLSELEEILGVVTWGGTTEDARRLRLVTS